MIPPYETEVNDGPVSHERVYDSIDGGATFEWLSLPANKTGGAWSRRI